MNKILLILLILLVLSLLIANNNPAISQDAEDNFNKGSFNEDLKDDTGDIKDFTKASNFKLKEAKHLNANDLLGDYTEAIEYYSESIKHNPKDPILYYNRGNSKYKLGDYTGAIEDFTNAIELNPNFAEAYCNRGLSKRILKKSLSAGKDFEFAKNLYLNSKNMIQYKEMIRLINE